MNNKKELSFKKRFLRTWIIATIVWTGLSLPMGMLGDMFRQGLASAVGGIIALVFLGFATSAVIHVIKAVFGRKK
jgi:hypothetical protein